MRNGYTNIPDELIEKYGLVGANIVAFANRCKELPTHMTPSVRFIANHFKIDKTTVQRHIHLIRGTKRVKRGKMHTPTAAKCIQSTAAKCIQTTTLQTTLKTTPETVEVSQSFMSKLDDELTKIGSQPLAKDPKNDVETASEIRHSELGTDPSKLVSRYGKSPIVDPLSDVRRLNDVVTSDGRPMMSFDEFKERLGRGESVRLDQVRRTK